MDRVSTPIRFKICICFPAFIALAGLSEAQTLVGTAFTYQGRLTQSAEPVQGSHDFRFFLSDAEIAGAQVGPILTIEDVMVSDGRFTVELDFGADAFTSEARWLDIAVRPGDSEGVFAPLVPRQRIRPVPHALTANEAGTLDGLHADDLLDKATYDADGNGKVDAAAEADLATMAVDSDLLDGLDSIDLLEAAAAGVESFVREFVVAPGEMVNAGEVVSFLDESAEIRSGYEPAGFGGEFVFCPTPVSDVSAGAFTATRFVVAYQDVMNSGSGTAVVGEVSGDSIGFGAPVVFDPAASSLISVAVLSSDRFVVAYQNQQGEGAALVGEVTGNMISFGSEMVFANQADFISAIALAPDLCVIAHGSSAGDGLGAARVGQVSGNSLTLGTSFPFNDTLASKISAAPLTSDRFVVAFQDLGNVDYGTVVVGEVSGTSIAYGPKGLIDNVRMRPISAVALSPSRFVVAYQDLGNSGFGTARVGEVSGTSVISLGPKIVFNAGPTPFLSAARLSPTRFVVALAFFDIIAAVGEVFGVNVQFDFRGVLDKRGVPEMTEYPSCVSLSPDRFLIAYDDTDNSGVGTVIVNRQHPSAVIGVARESAAEGQSAPVTLFVNRGISDAHSDLIPGQTYYAQPDGAVTPEAAAVVLGVAISPIELLFLP